MRSNEVPTVPHCPFERKQYHNWVHLQLNVIPNFELVLALIITYEDNPATLRAVPRSLIDKTTKLFTRRIDFRDRSSVMLLCPGFTLLGSFKSTLLARSVSQSLMIGVGLRGCFRALIADFLLIIHIPVRLHLAAP